MGRKRGTKLEKKEIKLNNFFSPKHEKRNYCYNNCIHMENLATSLKNFLAFQPVRSPKARLHWLQFVSTEPTLRTVQKKAIPFTLKLRGAVYN